MNKELQTINEISGLPFSSAGKHLPFSGSGKKRRLPMFNITWNDVVPEPKITSEGFYILSEYQKGVKEARENWEGEVSKKIQSGIDKLRKAGYTIEDPILMTYVYKYDSYFIYK